MPAPTAFNQLSNPRAVPEVDAINDSDMAMMEDAYQNASIGATAGEEVEVFAKYLDNYVMFRGSTADKRARLLKLVDHYYDYTHDRAESLREKVDMARSARGHTGDMDVDEAPEEVALEADADDLAGWVQESQTWDLLRRLLPLRYREVGAAQKPRLAGGAPTSRRDHWNDFMLSDSRARERKTVLEWLQHNANDRPDVDDVVRELQRSADRGDIVAHGWLHTRSAIKQQKRIVGTSEILTPEGVDAAGTLLGANRAPMVTQLDPDAMRRQGRRLAQQDEYFERSIWLGCFELLRRGKSMAEIRDWCTERTEAWRAVTIAPLPLSAGEDEDWPDYDPLQTILWRRMCFTVAREGGPDDYERAVYGLLSGDITSVVRVCKTWDDFLFAHYSALLRTQFDAYLVKSCPSEQTAAICDGFPSFNAVQLHGDPASLSTRLVTSLEANDVTRQEALTPIKALQGAIISDTLDNFFYQQGLVISSGANDRGKSRVIPDFGLSPAQPISPKYINLHNHNAIRILTHILIITTLLNELDGSDRDSGRPTPFTQRHQIQEHLIAAYGSYLRLVDLSELVPLYASRLIGMRRYANMSVNLIHITDREAQLLHLNLMLRLGMNVKEFVEFQPRFYLQEVKDEKGVCPAKETFKILLDGPPRLKYGREIKPDFVGGEDEDVLEREDEMLIRSMEWLMLADDMLLETCDFGTRIYRYFFKHAHLNAARMFADRVRLVDMIRQSTGIALSSDAEPSWFEDIFGLKPAASRRSAPGQMGRDPFAAAGTTAEEVRPVAQTFWEFECLAKTLETIDTISACSVLHRDMTASAKDLAAELGGDIKTLKGTIQPLLKDWLLGTDEDQVDYQLLREAYLPDTIIAYVSSLQFAGTTVSRDNMLEAMELAAVIAEKESDLAQVFVRAGRMKELVEAFASCSKALAVWTSDKKAAPGGASKKLRETGWSRELWSVKP